MKRFILPVLFATTLLGSALNADTATQAVEVLENQWTQLRAEWDKESKDPAEYGEDFWEMKLHAVARKIVEFKTVVNALAENSSNKKGQRFKGIEKALWGASMLAYAAASLNAVKYKHIGAFYGTFMGLCVAVGTTSLLHGIVILAKKAPQNSEVMQRIQKLKADIDQYIVSEDIARWA